MRQPWKYWLGYITQCLLGNSRIRREFQSNPSLLLLQLDADFGRFWVSHKFAVVRNITYVILEVTPDPAFYAGSYRMRQHWDYCSPLVKKFRGKFLLERWFCMFQDFVVFACPRCHGLTHEPRPFICVSIRHYRTKMQGIDRYSHLRGGAVVFTNIYAGDPRMVVSFPINNEPG